MARQAFTLVEIAVVLVIIALLVGGVLVGRDLMKAATVKNFTSTIEKYNAGASTFRIKYKALPGDIRSGEAALYGFATRTGGLGQGDGNGILEGCAQTSTRLGCETALFWRDLWEGHVSPVSLTAATDIPVDGTIGGFRIENYLPGTAFRTGIYLHMYALNSRNSYYVSRISTVASDGTLTTAAGLTPQEARDIDDKVDDAAPDNGIVRAMSALTTYDTGAAPTNGVCVNNTLTSLAYNLIDPYSSVISCQIVIRSQL